jgi:hypothetical protein
MCSPARAEPILVRTQQGPPEETDQEIELLLQSAQEDWSGLSQPEPAIRASQAKDTPGALPTPESTPERTTQNESEPEPEPDPEPESDVVEMPRGWKPIPAEAEAPDRRLNNAPRRKEISSQLSESNVLTGKRQRQRKTLGTYFVAFAAAGQYTRAGRATVLVLASSQLC